VIGQRVVDIAIFIVVSFIEAAGQSVTVVAQLVMVEIKLV
jgi:hypothetical protein